ncbi:MAG: hypothetical protein ACJ74Z_18970 [Bryobacteraceae bacterium]
MVIVVLLKAGELEAVASESRDVFSLARARDAGICGIFEGRADAEAYIQALREEQKRNSSDAYNNVNPPRLGVGKAAT